MISDGGIAFIKVKEGFKSRVYRDIVSIPTIGYGHVLKNGETFPDGITEPEAESLLREDIQIAEKCIANSVKVELTQGQYDALCSFVYNLGCKALRGSTLLRKLNDGDDVGAADEFSKWHHAGGKDVFGLMVRREAEKAMFLA